MYASFNRVMFEKFFLFLNRIHHISQDHRMVWIGGSLKDHLLWSAGHTSFNGAQNTIGFLGWEHTLLSHVELHNHQHAQVLRLRAALNPFFAQPVFVLGFPWPMCRTLRLALLNFMRFTSAHHSSLSRHPFPPVCWPRHKACHHQACWGRALSYSVLLTKMLNSSSSNTSPWGTPLVMALHLDIKPLTTTPWVQPSSQFLVHWVVRPSSLGQFIRSCCIDPD